MVGFGIFDSGIQYHIGGYVYISRGIRRQKIGANTSTHPPKKYSKTLLQTAKFSKNFQIPKN